MKTTVLALTIAALASTSAATVFAADGDNARPCNPPRPGYVMDETGKCVKAPPKHIKK